MQFRYVSLSKRPLTGKNNKLKSFVPSFIQSSRKYSNYFQSPSKDDELLLVKKKFIKLSKKGKSTSSFLSFISSINNLYLHKKKYEYNMNNKTSKNNNNLILTSIDNSSIINSKDKIISYNSNNNSHNINMNKSRKKSKKKTPELKYFNKNKINGCSFTTTGGNDKSKNKNNIISKTGLNSKKNSKEKEVRKEKKKGKKNNNKILIKKLNDIQIINTIKPSCNSYRTSGGIGLLLNNKGRAYPFTNKNILDSIFYRLEKPKTSKIQSNNLNLINIFDDYLRKAKGIKNNKKAKNINYNNFNYSNVSNKKIQTPVNKNLSMNFNIPNLNYINNQSNNKISKTAKVSPRGQLINFNSIIYSNNNKNRSKGKNKNSSYRSSKEVHSSSWRNVFKSNNYNNKFNKFKNNSSINNLNIVNQAQNLKYISTYYKTKKIKQPKNNSDNKNYISNNTNNIINTINGNEINNNINSNINCMSNTYNLYHNIGGTMYNNYNINISNQINNNYKKITKNQQQELFQLSKNIKNNTANNSPNKNMTFKIITNSNNNGYINISIGLNNSSSKNKKKKNNKKLNLKKINKNKKEKEEKNKNDDKMNNIKENKKLKNEKILYFEKYNSSEEKAKKDKIENYKLENDKNNQSQINNNSNIHDCSYYMKLSEKLSSYIKNYYNKFKKYPYTSLSFYKYGRLIGQGAFGKVNLGLNILTGRVVAIKSFMKKNLEINGENMRKIMYETNLMRKLNHKNITKILEMFEDKKYILIIMEYINGGNLFSFVKKRRKLSEKTAKFLFRQIIEGIKHIHEHNIIHRDIKLENILIDINNNIKICDFGIGKILSSEKELLYDQCGTPMYMAPEIFLCSKKKGYEGPPVDIWSSGIALYIMLSGTLPFDINKNIYIKRDKNNLTDSNSLNSEENENEKKL